MEGGQNGHLSSRNKAIHRLKDARDGLPFVGKSGRQNGRPKSSSVLQIDNSQKNYEAKFKVIVVGEATVGKTSLIHSAMGEKFDPTLISTIGIDFAKRTYSVDGYNIQLELWDTAGQERFRSLSTLHYRDAKGFILVYDTTNYRTFERIQKEWLSSIDNHIDEPVPIFFVGNKIDLKELREVDSDLGRQLAEQQCAHGFSETSAKTNENVQDFFYTVAESMIAHWGAPKRYYEMQHSFPNNAPHNGDYRQDVKPMHQQAFQLDSKTMTVKESCCKIV